jgi:hypothetical protein
MDGAQRVLQLDHPGRSGVVVLAVSRPRLLRLGYLKGISSLDSKSHIPLDYRRALVLRGSCWRAQAFVKPQISSVQIPFSPCVLVCGPKTSALRHQRPSPTRVSRSLPLHYSLCSSPTSVEDPSEEKIKTTVLAAASLIQPTSSTTSSSTFTLVPRSPHKHRQHAYLQRKSRHSSLDRATEGGAF